MNKDLTEERRKTLEDNISQDQDLLKSYEDKLRYKTDPRRLARYRREIERQQEYDELRGQLTGEPPAEMRDRADGY